MTSRAGVPGGPVRVPAAVARIAGGGPVRAVWRNELGGFTFEMRGAFAKWTPRGSGQDLGGEAARLRWALPFTPVPRVLSCGADDEGSCMVTAALPGTNAVEPRWKASPEIAVRAIGGGLRAMHDAMPVGECPFSWSVADRLAGRRVPSLGDAPPIDRLVVCHGDACAPNTLIADDGTWSAHVDLGQLGVADRWADIAVATWSTEWNYGPGWEPALLDAYGIAPDPVRSSFYRRLWSAT